MLGLKKTIDITLLLDDIKIQIAQLKLDLASYQDKVRKALLEQEYTQ